MSSFTRLCSHALTRTSSESIPRGACVESPGGLFTTRQCSSSKSISIPSNIAIVIRHARLNRTANKKSPGSASPGLNFQFRKKTSNLARGRNHKRLTIFSSQHSICLVVAGEGFRLGIKLQIVAALEHRRSIDRDIVLRQMVDRAV